MPSRRELILCPRCHKSKPRRQFVARYHPGGQRFIRTICNSCWPFELAWFNGLLIKSHRDDCPCEPCGIYWRAVNYGKRRAAARPREVVIGYAARGCRVETDQGLSL